MNVAVQEHAFSMRCEYEISTPGCIYSAQKKFFSFRDKITLRGPRGQELARINSRFSFFRCRYDFELSEGKIYLFWRGKVLERGVVSGSAGETVRIHEHKGLHVSVVYNNPQI